MKCKTKQIRKMVVLTLFVVGLSLLTSSMTVFAINRSEVTSKLNTLVNQYNGKTVTQSQLYMGSQCKGFANWVFLQLYGVYIGPYPDAANYKITNANADLIGILEPGNLNESSAKALLQKGAIGDYIQVQRSTARGCGPHSMILYEVNSSGIVVFDCNSDGKNTIKKQSISYSDFDVSNRAMSLYRARGYDPAVQNNPVLCVDSAAGGVNSVRVSGWAYDLDNKTQSLYVHVYIGGPAGSGAPGYQIAADKVRTDVGNAYPGVGNYHGYSDTIVTDKTGTLDIYIYAINIGSGDHSVKVERVNITKDTEGPTITAQKVLASDANGYMLYCEAADNIKVNRVSAFTWTQTNGQDDMKQVEMCPQGNNVWKLYVPFKDHNNENDYYINHIYVYDMAGNENMREVIFRNASSGVDISTKSKADIGTDFSTSIVNSGCGKVLTEENGGNVVSRSDNGSNAQRWKFIRNSDGTYTIKSVATGKCLDNAGGTGANESNIQTYASNNSAAQKWSLVSFESDKYCLVPQCSKYGVLDLFGNNSAEGANIRLYLFNGSNAQLYTIKKPVVAVTGVSVNQTAITLTQIGAQQQITATVAPSNATDKGVSWSSNNSGIVSVDSTGKVTAKASGSAVITAKTNSGAKTAACTVTVKIPVTGVTLNTGTMKLQTKGATGTLVANIAPASASNKNVSWSSNNTSIATVDANGKVTAVAAGTAIITATTNDGNKTATCQVHVSEAYTITYHLDGGTNDSTNPDTYTSDQKTIALKPATKAHYVFLGWFTSETDGEAFTAETICSGNLDLYAHWTEDVIVTPDPVNNPTVAIGTVKGQAGKEVTVPVTITKNSGIAGFSLDVNYDSTKLTLKSMTAGEVLTTGSVSTNLNVVNWYTTDNIAVDGTVLNLTFDIAADAAAGQIPVSVALHDGKKNLVDENGVYVEANYQAGYVEVVKGILGDMNGDDDLTIADVVLLNKHVLNKATLDAEHLALADVNKDGDITIGDVVLLNRCVLGRISLQADARGLKDEVIHSRALTAMSVTADDITANPGEKISVPIRVKGNTGFAGLAFSVNVPQGYTLNSITAGEMLAAGTFSTNENNCTWYTTDNIRTDGILMTLNLTAAADAKTAKISVTVKDGKANNMADENGMTVPVEFTAGTITVGTQTECEKNGHKEVKDEAVAATCTEAGKTEGSHCSVCNEVIKAQETIPALGHKEVKDEAVAATCTEPGKTEGSHCSVCNEVIKAQEEIPAFGHDWDEGTVTKPASCSEEGVRTYTCSRCSETKTEVIAKISHTEVKDEAVAATCTSPGKTEGSHCSVCNEVIKAQEEVPALGHDWDEGTVTTPATCTEDGSKTFNCSRCDEAKTEVIPEEGHKWNDWKVTKAATYDQAGSKERICSACNEKETEVIPKLVRTSITKASVSGITNKAYTAKAQTQSSLVVKVAGKTLKNGTDYSVAYKNNTNLGKASLVITGKGIYTGSLTKTFNINVIKGQTYVVNGMKYQMTNTATNGSGTVTLTGTILGKDKVKTLTVADNVKIGNKYFAVTAIGNGAFKNYTKLTKLTIGMKVKTVGKDSFSGCKALKNIDIKTKNLTSIGKNAFMNINKKANLKVPSGKKNAYMKMFKKSTNIKL